MHPHDRCHVCGRPLNVWNDTYVEVETVRVTVNRGRVMSRKAVTRLFCPDCQTTPATSFFGL